MTKSEAVTACQLEATIAGLIAERGSIDPSMVDRDENIMTSGLIDSVGMMRLIADLEEMLEVTVPPPDLVPENFRTVRVMANYLSRLHYR